MARWLRPVWAGRAGRAEGGLGTSFKVCGHSSGHLFTAVCLQECLITGSKQRMVRTPCVRSNDLKVEQIKLATRVGHSTIGLCLNLSPKQRQFLRKSPVTR